MKKLLSVVLVLSMLFTLAVPFSASAEETEAVSSDHIYTGGKVWFYLNGNSRLFVKSGDTAFTDRATYDKYLPGVDFAGYLKTPTGDFAEDQAAVTMPGDGGAMFYYSVDKGTAPTQWADPDLKTGTDGNIYWTINNVDYLLRTNEKIIKNFYTTVDTSALSDEDMIARYKSLNNPHVIDVPDKKYSSIGFLAGSITNYTKKLKVSLYYEGDEEPVVYDGDTLKMYVKAPTSFAEGTLYLRNFKSASNSQAGGQTYFVPHTIQTDSNKVLTRIEIDDVGYNSTIPFYVISAWGVEQTLAEKITALTALNTAGITSTDIYYEVFDAVNDIDDYLVNYSTALTEEQKAVYDTAKANLTAYENTLAQETLYASNKEWFELQGNSRLFAKSDDPVYTGRASYIDYLPGVDFAGFVSAPTGTFSKDQAAVTLPAQGGAIFAYTVNENPSTADKYTLPDFSYENGNYYWTIEDVPYLIRPDENVIKVASGTCTLPDSMDESKKARYQSLKDGTTIDIPDGNYNSIGFLVGAECNWRKSYDISLYYEGEEVPVTTTIVVDGTMNATGTSYKDGTINLRTFLGTTTGDTDINFLAQEVTANPTKVLTAVKFADNTTNNFNPQRNGFIISAWGNEVTLAERFENLTELNTAGITDVDSYAAVKAAVDGIDEHILKTGCAFENLKDADKVTYDTAKASLTAYENKLAQETLYASNKEWFDLNGNSKLFMNKNSDDYTNRANLINYLPGVDYTGYLATPSGTFATDKGAVTNSNLSIFTYTVDASTATNSLSATLSTPADFKTGDDEKLYFVYNDVAYRVDPTKKVIKSAYKAITTTNIKNTEDVARYESLKTGVTMDVPNANYKNIGFLTAVRYAYSKAFKVELFYEGEETPVLADDFYRQTPPKTSTGAYVSDIYFHTLAGTGGAASGYYFTPWTIEIDSSKKLDKIRVYDCGATPKSDGSGGTNGNNPEWPIHFISSWGDELTLAERFTELEGLNTTGVTDVDSYAAVKAAVDGIDEHILKTGCAFENLKDADKATYNTAVAALAAYKASNDDLVIKTELEFEGNSKLFMNKNSDDYTNRKTIENYLPGLDYAGYVQYPEGVFATDKASADNDKADYLSCFGYTIGEGTKASSSSTPDFTTGANGKTYWTINDVDYMVRPEEKIIKLHEGISVSKIEDSAIKAKYATLLENTIDVPAGKYDKLTFLAGILGADTYNRDVNVTLIYEDGTEPATFLVEGSAIQSLTWAQGGLSFPRMIESSAAVWTRDWHTFAPYEVDTDETRVLTAVKLEPVEKSTANSYKYPIYILSISGSHTIKDALSAVDENMPKADAKVILSAVDATLAENNITAEDLSAETKALYDTALYAAGALEITEASYESSAVTVKYDTGRTAPAKLIVAQYNETETQLVDVTVFPVEFTAGTDTLVQSVTVDENNKIKVLIWKDLIDFYPYK